MLTQKPSWQAEVIPDSEDEPPMSVGVERQTPIHSGTGVTGNKSIRGVSFTTRQNEIIEISSSEFDDEDSRPVPGSWNRGSTKATSSSKLPQIPSKHIRRSNYMRSRVIESSDSGTSDQEPSASTKLSVKVTRTTCTEIRSPSQIPGTKHHLSTTESVSSKRITTIQTTDNDSEEDNGAIMVFDEPKSARNPIPFGLAKLTNPISGSPATPVKTTVTHIFPLSGQVPATATPSGSVKGTPKKRGPATPRVSKKKTREEEQTKLREYADEIFSELNQTVFGDGLPLDTKLNWNKRLLTTAGRAKWHRSRDGIQTSEIELAEKILTSNERIRNTLSHEMCHLASWVIDKEINEGHGKFWKAWTRSVMVKYPHIDISTRHDYEIEYPYKWMCAKCGKIYGRFSKSIKPDECVCGACKEGKLIPQFEVNARTVKPPVRISRMAATKGRDSPCPSPARVTPGPKEKKPVVDIIYISSDSDDEPFALPTGKSTSCGIDCGTDSEDEIEVLALTLQSSSLAEV